MMKKIQGEEEKKSFIRLANKNDLSAIMKITKEAKARIKKLAFDQWQNDYPNEEVFLEDILLKRLYVYGESECVLAFFVLSKEKEKSYEELQWKSNNSTVIHRIAVADEKLHHHIASKIFAFCIAKSSLLGYDTIKVDTHRKNLAMLQLINKYNFKYRGYIKSINREAFEKEL